MHVLHLMAEYRWTGPVEAVVNMVVALRARGIRVDLACAAKPGSLVERAVLRGVNPKIYAGLNRRQLMVSAVRSVREMADYVRDQKIDIVHTHLPHDHILGGLAARRSQQSRRIVRVIRTNHKAVSLHVSPVSRWVWKHLTDGYLGFDPSSAQIDAASFALAKDQIAVVSPAVDSGRFDPRKKYRNIRNDLGWSDSRLVVGGIIARLQRHRRFEVLFEALAQACAEVPELRFLVIGAGTHTTTVARQPIDRLGLNDRVMLTGARQADYVDHLAGLDFSVFLVPGSDGTCRAVREMMAMGRPVIAARRGILNHLVPHGRCGLVIDDTPKNLAEAIVLLATDHENRRQLGEQARRHAEQTFNLARQVDAVIDLYNRLLAD